MRSNLAAMAGAGFVAAVVATVWFASPLRAPSIAQVPGADSSTSVVSQRDPKAFAQVVERMRDVNEAIDGFAVDWELREALPNVRYSMEGAAPESISDFVVAGKVTSTRPGRGIVEIVGEEGVPLTEVAFDSPRAAWTTMHLTVQVEQLIGSAEPIPQTIDVEILASRTPGNAVMLKGFAGQRVLLFLDQPGTLHWMDPAAYTISGNARLLGFIADDDTISMPSMSPTEAQYIGDLTTLDAVVAQAKKPIQVIEVDKFGERNDPSTYPAWTGLN